MRHAPILVALFLTSASAQEPKFEPNSKPGAGQALLAKFEGDWDVVKTFHPRQGEPVVSRGRCRQAMVRDGRFLQSDFTFGAGDAETSGQGLIGFEPETGRFTSVWTDSRQTRMSVRRSKDAFDGKTIVMESVPLGPGKPDARRSKTVSTLEDDGRKIVHRQFGLAADGTERLVMTLEMTRRPR